MNAGRVDKIRIRLEAEFAPVALDIVDDSAKHAGHAGARDGKGHFNVHIVSERFRGTKPLERHRMVYAALGELMRTDIHALQVVALSPERQGNEES